MRVDKRLVLAVAVTLAWGAGCGKKDDGDSSGGDKTNPDGSAFAGQLNLSDDVDMKALPMIEGSTTSESVMLAKSADVAEGGAFSLELPAEYGKDDLKDLGLIIEGGVPESLPVTNWVFVLINKDVNLATATPSERLSAVNSFVGISDDKDSLVNIPTGDIEKGAATINLGDIGEPKDGFANSSTTVEDSAESLNREVSELQEIASTDDPLRSTKNLVANFDPDTEVFYSAEPFFIWNGDQSTAIGSYSDAADYDIGGFGIYFNSNDSRVSLDSLCSPKEDSKHVALEIIPPGDVTGTVGSSEVTFNKDNPMTNEDAPGATQSAGRYDCSAGTMYASGKINSDEASSFNVGGGGFSTAMPEGVWTLTLDGKEAAAFDMAAANPNDSDGNPLVYVPAVKISKNGSDVITSIEFKWYRYNKSTKKYDEVTDLAVFNETVQEVAVDITDYSGTDASSSRIEENVSAEAPSSGATFKVSGWDTDFKVGTSSDTTTAVAESITIRYEMYGINIRFDLR